MGEPAKRTSPPSATGDPQEDGWPSRRQFVAGSLACGLSAAGWHGAGGQGHAAPAEAMTVRRPARHVIFVLMSGAPSQFETFDPKPGAPTGGMMA
jgi:hypothetical protein